MLASLLGPRDIRARFGDPLVVGGTGGSGTGSVAQLLLRAGFQMGSRLNAEYDAEHLAAFDWQNGRRLLRSMIDRPAEVGSAVGMACYDPGFRRAVRAHLKGVEPVPGGMWGWKHPHSYVLLPYLRRHFPGLRFIQVVRDGRDIAFSDNQRQVRRYGHLLSPSHPAGPIRSAAYWSAANLYGAESGAALGDAYMVIRLEDLCAEPTRTAHAMLRWLGVLPAGAPLDEVSWAEDIIRTPRSIGRWRTSGFEGLDEVQAAARPGLVHFGYEV